MAKKHISTRLSKSNNLFLINRLDKEIFPSDERYNFSDCELWVLWHNKKPIGFCAMKYIKGSICYFVRAGVIETFQGYGLQKKLIKARIKEALKNKTKKIITYTTLDNISSARNLISCGFKLFIPEYKWINEDVLYFVFEQVKYIKI